MTTCNNKTLLRLLQPMRWKDGWPVIGVDIDMNGIGEPVYVWKKPDVEVTYPITVSHTSQEYPNQIRHMSHPLHVIRIR